MEQILIICIVGAIAGLLASALVQYDSGSLLVDIFIGIVGGYIGYKLYGNLFAITENVWVNKTLTATVGAILLELIMKGIYMLVNRLPKRTTEPAEHRQSRYSRRC